ncbi:hypothetical protein [Kocuria arenosa]|uniref:hypothetical protein n=1 Tax=Kocuria arenosa TaxID=3071446 RepID=UPI0034D55E3A
MTLSAEVNDVLDDDAFVIAGTAETTVDPLLVLYNMDRIDIEEGQVVEVTGTVQQAFDLPTVEDATQKDLEDDPTSTRTTTSSRTSKPLTCS